MYAKKARRVITLEYYKLWDRYYLKHYNKSVIDCCANHYTKHILRRFFKVLPTEKRSVKYEIVIKQLGPKVGVSSSLT